MKRVLALLLALVMVLSMTATVWAVEGEETVDPPSGGDGQNPGGDGNGEGDNPGEGSDPPPTEPTHTFNKSVTTEPTCGTKGVATYTCSVSGCTEHPSYTEDIPATGAHSFGDWKVSDSDKPTCTKGGTEVRTCSKCSTPETRSTDALGHDTSAGMTVTVPATCGKEGEKSLVCPRCKAKISEKIPATGNHTWDAGKVTKAATCTTDGEKILTCTVCSTTSKVVVTKLGHDFDLTGEVTKKPTCAEEGERTYTCQRTGCTEKYTEAIPKLKEHTWDKGTVTTAPTCVKTGVRTYKCTVDKCTETKTESIPMVNHSWDGGTVTIQPTVTEKGVSTHKCILCGKTMTRDVPPLGQSMDPDELATLKAAPNNAYGAKLHVEPWVMVQAVLDEEELARVQDGWPFSVTLSVKNISSDVSESERQLFLDYIADDQIIAAFLDVTLSKQMEEDPLQPVTETAEMVDIFLEMPTGLPELKKNVERAFMMLRLHDGVVEAVPTKLSDNGDGIIFQTDKFSTYVLTYTDTRAESSFPVLPVFIVLMLVALGGVVYLCKMIFIDHILDDDDDEDDDDYEDDYDDYEPDPAPKRSGRRLHLPAKRFGKK